MKEEEKINIEDEEQTSAPEENTENTENAEEPAVQENE